MTMSRFLTIVLTLLILAPPSEAQSPETKPRDHAIGTRLRDYGGFVELDTRFGDMMGDFAAFAGARGAVLLKQRLYVGLGGAGLATDNPVPESGESLGMGYGGLLIGYVVPTSSLVNVTADVLVGAGGLSTHSTDGTDQIFVFEPTVGLELRLARFARIGLGASYRYVGSADLAGILDSDLRGVTGTVSLRAGWF
jgi:hypothetical protein